MSEDALDLFLAALDRVEAATGHRPVSAAFSEEALAPLLAAVERRLAGGWVEAHRPLLRRRRRVLGARYRVVAVVAGCELLAPDPPRVRFSLKRERRVPKGSA